MAARVRMMGARLTPRDIRKIKPRDGEGRGNKRADDLYLSPEWRALRAQIIRERGWRCEDPKCETPYGPWKQIYGHHIVEIVDGGAPLDKRNVRLCCGVCHGRVTREAKAKRAGWIDLTADGQGGSKSL